MNLRTTLLAGSIPALLVLASTTFAVQDKPKPGAGDHGDMGGMPMPKPSKEHEGLKGRAGTWDATVTMTGMPPSKGTEVVTMIGPFHCLAEFKGEFAGMPFHGAGTTSYDPDKKEYVSTWADSMSPDLMVMRGTFDAAGKVLTQTAQAKGMDGKMTTFKSVVTLTSPDTHTFKMYMGDMPEPMLTIDYKRRK